MKTTRNEIRKQFKAIGYSVSFQRNPFNDSICNIAFKNASLQKPVVVSTSSVFGAEFFKEHEKAFTLANQYKNYWLDDTDQKIV